MIELRCMICGMKINDSNYSFNSKAFLNKNTKEDIESCPFCGVAKSFFSENGQTFIISEELDSKTLAILDKAMKLETFNGDFYSEAARLAKNPNVKEMFRDLSKIEYMHAKVHKCLGEFEKNPKLNKLDYSRYNNDSSLLEMAKKREEHAVSFYKKNYNSLSNDLVKSIFQALIKVEQEHIEITTIN